MTAEASLVVEVFYDMTKLFICYGVRPELKLCTASFIVQTRDQTAVDIQVYSKASLVAGIQPVHELLLCFCISETSQVMAK